MEKSKFTQAEISAGRRLWNKYVSMSESHNFKNFWDYLNCETRKGFADSVDNHDVPPFKIVKSDVDSLTENPYEKT